jgi:AcrR family transcriptional regulator
MATVHKPKRELILRHAIEVFANEGFRNADVQAIADRAVVGKGTVYRHFGNKEELFWSATYWVLERLGQHLSEIIQRVDDPLEALRAAGIAYAEFFERNPSYLEIFVQNRAEFRGSVPPSHKEFHERLITAFVEVVERGIAQGSIRPIDPRRAIMSLGSVFYGTVMFGCYVKDEFRLSELAEYTLENFLRGIRTEQKMDA